MSSLELENQSLKQKIQELELVIKGWEDKFASYTEAQHKAQRKYVEANPEITRQRKLAYQKKLSETDPERLAAYRHTAYMNRKARLQAQKEESNKNEAE
jgi:hypothetical protein